MKHYYVCFAVLPAPGMDNQQRSRTVMKSLNPLYNEMFTFSVSNGRLPQSQLHCSVWDYDRITTDDFIGQVCLNLCEVDWTDREPHWYDLTDKVICSLFGYVDVTVEFNLPHFLLVTVHCIRDLHIVETAAPSSLKPYVVCSVTGLNQTHRTPAYEVSNCIVVDESFEFSMAKEELLGRYVVVSVSDAQNISKSQWQGQCVIALSEVVPHEPVKDSYELGTPREYHDIHMTSAQQSALANEFQQALVAHAAFRQPSWLFEKKKSRRKDKGNRMLAVTSKRGGQQSALTAALTLQNGQVDSI
ncbi:synaptotagmin-3-like isoform X2 [Corticium candelabrum]|uniref:synaptotagmin-3-like isoform X2 n=1 Tax=Corticium candelabrum TaxID=121492 RepID=UPI002E2707DA|nr:synaptotagmin-3-like isoform X2 [Corticium candelabrum]